MTAPPILPWESTFPSYSCKAPSTIPFFLPGQPELRATPFACFHESRTVLIAPPIKSHWEIIRVFVCLCLHLSVSVFVCVSTSISPFTHMSLSLSPSLSVCIYLCLSLSLYVSLLFTLFPYFSLSLCPFVAISNSLPLPHLCLCLSPFLLLFQIVQSITHSLL